MCAPFLAEVRAARQALFLRISGISEMNYERIMFGIAGVWNLIGAGVLLFAPEVQLSRLGIDDLRARWLARMLASSATTWGVAYLLIAFDAQRFRDLIWLGAVSKILFAVITAVGFLTGAISLAAFAPGIVDLVFAALFAEVLWRTQ